MDRKMTAVAKKATALFGNATHPQRAATDLAEH